MYSTSCCLVFIVAATTAAVLTDTKPTTDPHPPNSTLSTTSPTATPKSSDEPEDDLAESAPHKRTVEQTVGYGYRYNSVLRPVGTGSGGSSLNRNRPQYQQRAASPTPITPSPTPASYYFQQQVQSASPKPLHRFSGPYTTYSRYNRPESSETRPVTEEPVPVSAIASLQPQQDNYREVFTFDEAVSSPYHIAARAEHPQILPQALIITPPSPHHQQQIIPVLILRLDTATPFPYSMMALLREDMMSKMYAPQDPALHIQQYADPPNQDSPSIAYYTPETHHQARRVLPMTPSQPDPYRGPQEQVAIVGKVRRPPTGASAPGNSAPGTRTEVTIHHSPGMTAQDYKESVEQDEEA